MTDITFFENVAEYFRHSGTLESRDERWADLLFTRPTQRLVHNVRTKWAMLRVGDALMPTTINDCEYENSYVCSPYTGCILYPQTEINKLTGWLLPHSLRLLLHLMGPPLRAAQINRVVCINNWLLSTNLYHDEPPCFVPEMTRMLVERYPNHAIAFRSLNSKTNQSLLVQLEKAGYLLAPSRQVYFFDGASGEYLRKANNRWDAELLAKTGYELVLHEELRSSDAQRFEELYRKLYCEKHSEHNPQYTAEMLDEYRSRRLLKMWGLRDRAGRLDAFVGSFERNGVMTVPLAGYDTSLPMEIGLYRMIMAIVLGQAADRKVLLNLSSGASSFKRLRGGMPSLEYTAVYCNHLPRSRRIAWHVLAGLLQNVGAPILQKYQL
jgi:hypothetical protein